MLVLKLGFVIKRGLQQFWRLFLDTSFVFAWISLYLYLYLCCISLCDLFTELQSINQSNPDLLKERVRIPRTRRAGGTAMLWGALPLDGVGSCRLFFTDDLHDTLSWVPASDKPQTCPNHLSRRSRTERQGRISLAWHADHPLMGHPTAWPHKSSGS